MGSSVWCCRMVKAREEDVTVTNRREQKPTSFHDENGRVTREGWTAPLLQDIQRRRRQLGD